MYAIFVIQNHVDRINIIRRNRISFGFQYSCFKVYFFISEIKAKSQYLTKQGLPQTMLIPLGSILEKWNSFKKSKLEKYEEQSCTPQAWQIFSACRVQERDALFNLGKVKDTVGIKKVVGIRETYSSQVSKITGTSTLLTRTYKFCLYLSNKQSFEWKSTRDSYTGLLKITE